MCLLMVEFHTLFGSKSINDSILYCIFPCQLSAGLVRVSHECITVCSH